MANPNIVDVTSIYGKTTAVSLSTTNATTIISNASGSGVLLKINSLNISNTSASTVELAVNFNNAANLSGTSYSILTSSVPTKSTLSAIDKNTFYYLEENQSIGITAATGNVLVATCSYEVIG